MYFFLVGRFGWREDKAFEFGVGWAPELLYLGEYTQRYLPDNCREVKSIWTGEHRILEKDENWIDGDHFQRGNHVFSFKDPEPKFEISAKAVKFWWRLWMLGGSPVYSDGSTIRNGRTDEVLCVADNCWPCDAGFAVRVWGKLHFTDGVREDLPLGEIGPRDLVTFLRVSETEYSIRVGVQATEYRYYLLDVANWTCRRV